jgi:hypothetical protein
MKVKGLKYWIYKPYCKNYLTKGIQALKSVAIEFLYKTTQTEELSNTTSKNTNKDKETANTPHSAASNFGEFFGSDEENDTSNTESLILNRNKTIDAEVVYFSSLLGDPDVVKNTASTSKFWERHRNKMPILDKLQTILLNISSSSAFIERFFSISGIVCDARRLNQSEDLIIMKSLCKANMNVLTEMNEN